jgi:catechol 1,2-dioxygenase
MAMPLFREDNSTEVVTARHAQAKDARVRHAVDIIVKHLHAAVRELEPTREEWATAIEFLTQTGAICSPTRQEFILLSDTLGISMLVDAINHRREGGGTESTVLGPFYVPGAQALPMGASIAKDGKGDPMLLTGRVVDLHGNPIADATLDVWQASPSGFYDVQDSSQPLGNLRGVFRTGRDGAYRIRTVAPSSYPIPDDGPVGKMLDVLGRHPFRPAHVHFMVGAKGFRTLTTHLFVAGDPYLESDAVFGVKESLVVHPVRVSDPAAIEASGFTTPFAELRYDFALAPVRR